MPTFMSEMTHLPQLFSLTGMTAQAASAQRRRRQRRQQKHALVGARRDQRLFEHELQKIGERLQQAEGSDDVRAAAHLHRRPHFAVHQQQEGDDDQKADNEHSKRPADQRQQSSSRKRVMKSCSVSSICPLLRCAELVVVRRLQRAHAGHHGGRAGDRIRQIEIRDGRA